MILSAIIPVYKEPLLQKTIQSFLDTSELEVEVIVVFDGHSSVVSLPKDPRIKVVKVRHNKGMRNAINEGLKRATGKYIIKFDAHCLFDQGFDKKMVDEMHEDWLLIPRRYSLDDTNWKRDDARPYRDYHYLEYPHDSKYGRGLTVLDWWKRNDKEIDDTMIFQGSCWMADREYFMKTVGLLDDREETYGSFVGEQHEIGLKYWLKGGAIKVNKKTWYAHLSKRPSHYLTGLYERHFKTAPATAKNHTWVADHWLNNEEPNLIHSFYWLIEKFNPPTWPPLSAK